MTRTRRLTVPIAIALLAAGCATAPPAPGSLAAGASPPPPSVALPLATPARTAVSQATDPATPGPPPPTASRTVAEIARLQAAVAADPSDADSQRDLGLALLQRVRETADPSLYAPASAALETARTLAPDDALVLVGIGGLQLGKHQFAEALVTGRQAVAMSPNLATARAVVVDALVELGRYDEAETAAGEMLGVRSDLTTLTRVSYLAELHGKLDVALRAMRMAAASPGLAAENVAYVDALLGNLLVYSGDRAGAAEAYQRALVRLPTHAPSLAGEARLAVGDGRLDDAIALFGHAADIVPLPEYVISLGEAQTAAGRTDDAARSFKLARAEIQLFQASGVIVDLDLALFEADHGDPAKALGFAEAGYRATPTVRAADALAWALHRLGRDGEAARRAHEALRLGSRDPLFRYHGGAIEAALGDTADARRDLALALSTDPGFSAKGAAEARRILASLPD
jgi:tetratricopeptide (TPR) repeat protein